MESAGREESGGFFQLSSALSLRFQIRLRRFDESLEIGTNYSRKLQHIARKDYRSVSLASKGL